MMEHPLLEQLRREWPLETWRRHRTLVAVSGGADSVALLRGLVELGGTSEQLHLAHFDHRIRGEQSTEDASFVSDLSDRLEIPIDVESASLPASNESDARSQRYDFLVRSAYRNGCGYVATAHHRDDRIETTLHNIFRGSGLAGAATPRRYRPLDEDLVLVRPLLGCSRAEITDFLHQLAQPHQTDTSNWDTKYRRNYLRHQVLPELRNVYPNVDDSIHRFSELAEEAVELLHDLAAEYLERVAAADGRPAAGELSLVFPTLR
ncbi:MAG TPA: tRNA lysidine(34) synthetase TilS, partial [Planctomycetaceae bacterium]|nr:tRNA lysidine(34) synthetase TilS [Planctomycetaceae bacterium]